MSKPQQHTENGTENRYQMTTLKYWFDGEKWIATEPAGPREIRGTGDEPLEAVRDYTRAIEEMDR